MKPRITVYAGGRIRFLCADGRGWAYRCAFGATMREAYEKWAVLPEVPPEAKDVDAFWDDIPF